LTFEEDLQRLESFIGHQKAIQVWRAYQLAGRDERQELEAAIQLQLERRFGVDPLSDFGGLSLPSESAAGGKYELGTVVSGTREFYPFGVRDGEFIQHMAIFGRSGAGKTNTVALLIQQLVRHGKPFLIFDWKQNYRDLIAEPLSVPLDVYTVGRPVHPLRFNPLIPPPGTDTKIWLKKLIEIVSNAYYLGEGVMFMLQEAFDHVYTQAGCYERASSYSWPTMADVLEHLKTVPVKGRKALWLDSTLRAVQSLCFGQISDVINVNQNDSILDLLSKNACLELNSLAHAEKIFLIETLMVWIHHFRLLEGERETFKHCLIIEEAHNILSASKKETVIDLLLREIRELGEAIVLVDQHPSQISVPALGNTYCTIALNMKHSKDINALGDIMHVSREQRDMFGQLPMGRAVVKLQSRHVQPFEIHVPKVDLAKGVVTDTHLAQVYPPDSTDSAPESALTGVSEGVAPIPDGHKDNMSRAESLMPPIPETELWLLQDMRDHPLDGVVRRYNRIGVSRRQGNRAKESLIARGIIQPVDVATRTGKVVLLEFTSAMAEALKRGGKLIPARREGGATHAYWKRELERCLTENGWSVTTEKSIGNGQAVDLHALKNGTRLAVEIETGRRGVENIEKLLGRDDNWILSFGVDTGVKSRTLRALKRRGIHDNRIIFATPADFSRKIRSLGRSDARNG